MPINKIPGQMLESDLLREGVNLSFETDLLYIDVSNNTIGINNNTPLSTESLDVIGSVKINDLIINSNYLENLDVTGFQFKLSQEDLDVTGSKITNLAYPVLDPDAANKEYVDYEIANDYKDKIVSLSGKSVLKIIQDDPVTDTLLELTGLDGVNTIFSINDITSTFNNNVDITGDLDVVGITTMTSFDASGNGEVGSLNSITTIDAGTDVTVGGIVLANKGIILDSSLPTDILKVDYNSITTFQVQPSTGITTVTGELHVDQITLDANIISAPNDINLNASNVNLNGSNGVLIKTTVTDKDIILETTSTGIISIKAVTALTIPSGLTNQRPIAPEQGAIRFNQSLNYPEIFDGVQWTQFSPGFTGISLQQIFPDGVSQIYPLDEPATAESIFVSINGVLQTPYNSYTVSSNEITFNEVLGITDLVIIRTLAEIIEISAISDAFGTSRVETVNGKVIIEAGNSLRIEVLGDTTELGTDLLPAVNQGQDLGSPTNEFANLYVTEINGVIPGEVSPDSEINGGFY